jgi:ELWxxDGT repeat protein
MSNFYRLRKLFLTSLFSFITLCIFAQAPTLSKGINKPKKPSDNTLQTNSSKGDFRNLSVTETLEPTSVSANPGAICAGSSVSLTATCQSGTVVWYDAIENGTYLGSGSPLSQSPTADATYYAACNFSMGPTRVTVSESERVATAAITVIPLPGTPTGVSVNKTSILSGAPVLLSAACSAGNVVWYNQETGGSEIGVGTSVTYYPGANTTFYASCRSGSCESSRSSTAQVSVTNMPLVPYMVSDNIVPGAGSSDKDELINLNGTLFFITETPDYGRELWKSDGTIEGTVIVKDINPGAEPSYVSSLTKVGSLLFFYANDGEHGNELWISDGSTGGTKMVKDITAGINSTEIGYIADVNGTAFFTVNDEILGLELWKSDGTVNGTMLVKDIWEGVGSSNPQNLTNVNGTLFFTAFDETNGGELWKSDGTAAGTVMVKDIRTGTNQSSSPKKLTNVNGIVYFIANDGTNGNELWRSDGTTDGTYMVKDIAIGADGIVVSYMTSIDDIVYMVANTSQYGSELWRSDGTSNGTYLVKDINYGSNGSSIQKLVVKDKTLYFGANNGIDGYELWTSDGTLNGTFMLTEILPGSGSSLQAGPVNSDGTIYFVGENGEGGGVIWQIVGPNQSIEMVDISNPAFSVAGLQSLVDVNGKLFFKAALTAGTVNYGSELWSLGTCTGANKIVITDGKADYLNYQSSDYAICHCDVFNRTIGKISDVNAEVASSLINTKEWIDEVAPEGFVRRHYQTSTMTEQHLYFAEGKVTLYFTQADFDNYNNTATDGEPKLPADSSDIAGKDYLNIVRYAETNDETGLPANFNQTAETINPKNAEIVWNSALQRWEVSFATTGFGQFFVKAAYTFTNPDDVAVSSTSICAGQNVSLSASCGGLGTPIWYNTNEPGWENPIGTGSPFVVNPTEDITYYVSCKINDGDTRTPKVATEPITIATPVPQAVSVDKTSIVSGAKVKLNATCTSGEVVWYNQASGGSDIGAGSSIAYFPTRNITFYAACRTATCETSRIATETVNVTGMPLLPYKVKEVNSAGQANPDYFTSVNGTLFFIANSPGYGRELWKSDGTQEGTAMVKDIVTGAQSPGISQLKKSGGLLFFKTAVGVNPQQLWVSNGESSGTTMLTSKTKVDNITDVNGTVFFTATDSEHGSELWKSNGTAEGTVIVKDIWEGDQGSAPAKLTNVNGTLFFSANTSEYGRELWKSDGTPEGTVLVKDLISGSESLTPDSLRNINGILYFINTTDISGSGVGLWRSDGTADGTYSVKRINSVNYIVGVNEDVYFTGDDATHGVELWKSSGIPDDATLVKDINEAGSSSPQNTVVMDGILYFKATDGISGDELWKSNGSDGGTSRVKDINVGSAGALRNELINIDGTLYFFADNGNYEYGLWKSNGTEEGTELIRGVKTTDGYFPTRLSNINGKLYFNGDMFHTNDDYRKELWSLGTCTDANKMVFTSGKTEYYNVQQQLINETTTCHCDIYNRLMSKIDAVGENPVSGAVEVREWVDNTASTTHVKRHYEIYNLDDQTSNLSGTARVTLYFTQADFDAYNTAVDSDAPKLPTNSDDVTGKVNITIVRYRGTGDSDTGSPESYSVEPVMINPENSDIVWNNSLERWEVTFATTGLGGYFIKAVIQESENVSVSSTSICLNTSVTLNATCETGTVVWYNQASAGSSIGTGSPFVHSPTESTTYYAACNVEGNFSNRVATDEVIVTIQPTDKPTISVSKTTICSGESITLSATCTTGNVVWYNQASGGSSIGSGTSLSVSPGTPSATYYASCEIGSCVSDRDESDVITVTTIPSDPTDVAVSQNAICSGTTISLTAGSTSSTITWYNQATGGSAIGTGTSLSQSPSVSTTYYASCKTGNCESNRVAIASEVVVTPNPLSPTGVSASQTSICSGTSITLTASCTSSTITWYNQATGGSAIGTGTGLSQSPTVNTTYYASCKTGSCESSRVAIASQVVVTSIPSGPTGVSASQTAICSGSSITLTASCTSSTVTWYNQATGGSSIGTGTGLSQSPTVSTTYYASCKTGTCESSRVAIASQVVVTTMPSSPTGVTASQSAICSGTAVTLTASCTSSTITWYNQATGGSAIGTGTGLSQSPTVNTTFYASCKTGNCESSRVAIASQVVVSTTPSAPTGLSASQTSICSGTSITLTASCTSSTITWYNQATGGSAIGTGTGLSQSPTVSTTYYASCKAGNCESSRVAIASQVVVTTIPSSPSGVSVSQSAICNGTAISLTAGCTSGTVVWYNVPNGGNSLGSGTGLSQSPVVSITYYAACLNGSCESSRIATEAVTVTPTPDKPVISGVNEVCAGETIVLTASSNNSNLTGSPVYYWTGGSTGATLSITPSGINTYKVMAVFNGCASDSSDVFTVYPYERPSAPVITADNAAMCKGETVVLTATCPSQGDAFYWVSENARPAIPINPMYRNARNISAPGTYKGYCMSYGGCKSTETSITITQDAECGIQGFITVTPDKPVICPGTSVTLSASGCSGTITWTGGPALTTGTTATFSPGTTTTYLVQCSTGGNTSVTVSVAPATATVTKNISTGTSQVKAVNTIEADKKVGDPNYTPSPKVSYEAGKSILLKPGFVAEAGTVFKAEIKTCN